jgi:hypothetical protein
MYRKYQFNTSLKKYLSSDTIPSNPQLLFCLTYTTFTIFTSSFADLSSLSRSRVCRAVHTSAHDRKRMINFLSTISKKKRHQVARPGFASKLYACFMLNYGLLVLTLWDFLFLLTYSLLFISCTTMLVG